MAAHDWAATPLGPVASWPQSLRTTVNLCLTSRAPMMVVWGPEHTQLYNDALAPLMGAKHPAALGRPYSESFAEIWDEVMAPLVADVLERGESSFLSDLPVSFDRQVPAEEMFWTFSWSPLRDETGEIRGALHPAVETTGRVLAERRLGLLRDLATATGPAAGVQDACERAVAVLTAHGLDTPFSAVYLLDEQPGLGVPTAARLVAWGGVADVPAVFPAEVDLAGPAYTHWPLVAAVGERGGVPADLVVDPAALAGWPWPDQPPTTGVVLPLTAPGRRQPVALLAVGLSPRRPLDEAHTAFLQLLAGQLAAALATAALHEQQHRVAVALQRSLLPETTGSRGDLDVATRYLPGAAEAEVGGDWYDVVPLGAGRTALVVGDVMGRGVPAAAVMGQLRAAVRAYAQLDLPPERVLGLLDQLVEQICATRDIGQIVTCVYAVHDRGEGSLTLASAGHPPPLLLGPDGVGLWQGPVGPPLGTGLGHHAASARPLPPGSGLLLYTDGLVERRDSDLDDGIGRLLGAVAGAGHVDLERIADAALAIRRPGQVDDVALLAVRVPGADAPLPLVVPLSADSRAARTARQALTATLAAWEVPDPVLGDAALVASELVNNAVTHTGRPAQLRLRRLPDRIVLEVADGDPRPPVRLAAGAEEGGRGMVIVSALASAWGVRLTGAGKVVWCELPLRVG